MTRNAIQRREKGWDVKRNKSLDRQARQKQFLQDFMTREKNRTLWGDQLEDYKEGRPTRSLERMLNGNPTEEDIVDFFENVHELGGKTYEFSTEKLKGTITIVDFTRRDRL